VKDSEKTKEQLINELSEFRQQVIELKKLEIKGKEVEKALRESEKKYREMVQNTNVIVLRMDINGCITFFNEFAQKFFGYTEDEILGKNVVGTIVPEMDSSYRDLKAMIKDIIKNPEKYAVNENENICRNGERVWILWDNKGVFDKDGHISEILCIGNDITDRKQAEEALRRSQQEFLLLFRSSPEGLAYLDEKGNILEINPRFTELFGYTLQEVRGRNIDDGMIHPPDKIEEGKRLTKRSLEGYFNYETIRKKKDGTLFPISLSGSPVIINGQLKGIIALYQDITERKQNERLQQVLYNISKAVNSPISLNQLYPVIHQELSTIVDTTNFYIALVDEKEDKIFFPYNIDNTKPIHLPRTINHSSLVAQVIRTGKPIFVNQEMIQEGKTLIEFKEWFGTLRKVWLGVPLKVEDKTRGAIVVQSYTNPDLYSEKDIQLLEFISSQVAMAIERKSTEERIKHLSFHDALTGLYNRAYFEEELKRMNNSRYYPLSIISLDINGLKVVNDTFGHDQGDKLLQHLASLLASISRKGDIIARVGGDEFAILLPSTSSQVALDFCERIRKVSLEDNIEPVYLRVNLALGYVTQEGEYKDINTLLKEADQKMYQDKLFNEKSREKHLLDSFQLVLAERDPHTEDHARRLQKLALSLGKRVGLSEYQLNNLKLLALLHDIGKIGIPDSTLFKTYNLTPSEWKKMKEHSYIGYRMAKQIPDFAPIAREILYHHEHWDGSGYPEGLKGEEIPLLSRIISIVDAYDVMQSRRPYKVPITKVKALKEIKRYAGTQFDPQLVKIFLKIVKT